MATTYFLKSLKLGAGVAALAAAMPLQAQDNASADANATGVAQPSDAAAVQQTVGENQGDIVVTARRRSESLVNVPIAMTAISGAALENQGALDITDIAQTTPNVTLEVSRGTNSTLSAFIRGVGQQDPVAGFEQGVGIYVDDVYLNRPQAAVLDIYDVERVEVLRGPQGTLYGRNTTGGAVKYVTRRLDSSPELRLRGNLGTDEQADGIVSASTPVGDGTLRFGAALARLSRGGFGKNLTNGLENYNKDIWASRFSAEVNNEDNIFIRLAADYTKDNSNPRGGHRLIPGQLSGAPVLDHVYDTRGGLNTPHQEVKSYGASLFGEFQLTDMFTLRSITAYRKDKSATPIDFDALPAADVDVLGYYNNRQTSQELQLLVKTGRLNGLVGGYFLDANAATPFDVRIFTTVPGLSAFTNAVAKTETFAVFGDFTYDFTDQFSVSAGGRYTWDRRHAIVFRQNYSGGGSTIFGGAGIPFLGTGPSTNFNGSREYKKFTPRASVSFKPAPGQNLYVSYSKGFKGGGFDPRGVGTNAPDSNGDHVIDQVDVGAFLGFKPETVDSYEIGYKASFARRFNIALAAFRADYTDVQIPGSSPCTSGGIATFCGVTTNAGKARFQGVEAEGSAKLAQSFAHEGDALTLSGSLGYIDAKFRQYITQIPGKGPTEVSQYRHVQNTPKWTASGTLAYDTPIGGGRMNFNSTVAYKSKTYQFEIANPYLDQKGYTTWDASLVYHAPGDRWNIGIHGKNLTDTRYKTSGYTFMTADPTTGQLTMLNGKLVPALGKEGVLTVFYGNPRQVFLSVGLNF
jgi:iron complex outermembrane receptor protein